MIRARREGNDLTILPGSDDERVTILDWYHYAGVDGKDKRLETVHFADGTTRETGVIEDLAENPGAPDPVFGAAATATSIEVLALLLVQTQTASASTPHGPSMPEDEYRVEIAVPA
jgi:hypothetical protein